MKTFEGEFKKLLEVAESSLVGMSNAWMLFEKKLEVYIRIGPKRLANGKLVSCVQLANLTTRGGMPKKRGRFRRMCATIRLMTDKPFYVENANRGFSAGLERMGWHFVSSDGVTNCYSKYEDGE